MLFIIMSNAIKAGQYAVIFTSKRSSIDSAGYSLMAEKMDRLVSAQPGYVSHSSVRDNDGIGITVSYWDSLDAIRAWKGIQDHQEAQAKGKSTWYSDYEIVICRIERRYGLEKVK